MQTTDVPPVSSMSSTFNFRYCKMGKLTEDIAATLFWNTLCILPVVLYRNRE